MKTPGHKFKNKIKGIASSHSCTVEVLTARHWGFNTFSESLRGGSVTGGKFTHITQKQTSWCLWKSLFCKRLQSRWRNCENSWSFLIRTRNHLWQLSERGTWLGRALWEYISSSTSSYQVLQGISLSCGTSQREPGLKALWHILGWSKKTLWIKSPGRQRKSEKTLHFHARLAVGRQEAWVWSFFSLLPTLSSLQWDFHQYR